jgi:hypothetical protein|nr:MAG TPA: hypothetical protein [Caudoviricetes sp.]
MLNNKTTLFLVKEDFKYPIEYLNKSLLNIDVPDTLQSFIDTLFYCNKENIIEITNEKNRYWFVGYNSRDNGEDILLDTFLSLYLDYRSTGDEVIEIDDYNDSVLNIMDASGLEFNYDNYTKVIFSTFKSFVEKNYDTNALKNSGIGGIDILIKAYCDSLVDNHIINIFSGFDFINPQNMDDRKGMLVSTRTLSQDRRDSARLMIFNNLVKEETTENSISENGGWEQFVETDPEARDREYSALQENMGVKSPEEIFGEAAIHNNIMGTLSDELIDKLAEQTAKKIEERLINRIMKSLYNENK